MFHIIVVLAAGERHGYAILREVEAVSGTRLGPTTLYRSLKQLLEAGLVTEAGEVGAADQRRRTYRLTAAGTRAGQAETRRLAALVEVARRRRALRSPSPRGAR